MRQSILNQSVKACPPSGDRDISRALKEKINALKGDFFDVKKGGVDYGALKRSEAFEEYKATAGLLCAFPLDSLQTREAKLAFWINLYNALVVHGIAELNVEKSVKEVPSFFGRVCYEIGGAVFSLDDMEHGILRGNKRRYLLSGRPFSSKDPRRRFMLEAVDPRIHFALVCGSKSCPPIGVYEEQQIDQQLDWVSTAFINSEEVLIDRGNGRLRVSKIFKWYQGDFGGKRGLLQFLGRYRNDPEDRIYLENRASRIHISYHPYDWSLNLV